MKTKIQKNAIPLSLIALMMFVFSKLEPIPELQLSDNIYMHDEISQTISAASNIATQTYVTDSQLVQADDLLADFEQYVYLSYQEQAPSALTMTEAGIIHSNEAADLQQAKIKEAESQIITQCGNLHWLKTENQQLAFARSTENECIVYLVDNGQMTETFILPIWRSLEMEL